MAADWRPNPVRIPYVIYTTDTAKALAWQAAHPTDGSVVQAGPNRLAAAAGLPAPNYHPTVQPDPSGCWFIYFPDGSSPHIDWLDVNADFGTADPNGYYGLTPTPPYTDYNSFTYIWEGVVLPYYVTPPPTGGGGAIIARRWVCGFELGSVGNANLGQSNGQCCPSASRTADGWGFAVTKGSSSSLQFFTTAPPSGASMTNCSWERLYFRPVLRPDQGEVVVWMCKNNVEGGNSAFLTMTAAGELRLRNIGNGASPGDVLGTSAVLPLNTWAKLDLILQFGGTPPATSPGRLWLYLNGVQVIAGVSTTGTGISANGQHQLSAVGASTTFAVGGVSPTTYKYDLDDWIMVALPNNLPGAPTGVDWTNGTHIRLLNPTGIIAAGAWTGDWRGLAGNPPGEFTPGQMSASTASTRLLLSTDYVALPQLGLASLMVQSWPQQWPGSAPPLVGYRLNGGTLVQNTATIAGARDNFGGQLFNIAAGNPPRTDVTAIDIALDKDTGGTTVILAGLFGCAEYVGVWGPEDVPPSTTANRPLPRRGLHNAPYPEIGAVANPVGEQQWAQARQGTYVGNGVGQDIAVGVPFHWFWIRALGSNATNYWWSSQCAVHQALNGRFAGPIDINFPLPYPPSGASTSFHVSGAAASGMNANGVTYQWVAFSDPDSRFCLNGAVSWYGSVTPSVSNPLADPAFTPVCVFTAQEDMSSSIAGFFYRGPGNTGDTGNPLTSGDTAGVMTFATGALTTKAAAHSTAPQMAYSAWRAVDGSGASGAVDCVTYTGNGISSRNIAVNLGGMSPLFAFGIDHLTASYFRDPSHTGLDSAQVGSSNVTTAIIGGGTNYVTVGAGLNVSGRVYDIFVIAGGSYPGSWTPTTDPPSGLPAVPPSVPSVPSTPTPPVLPVTPPPIVVPAHGWWQSDAGFRGDVTAIGDSRPANPRSWKDFSGFATGAAAMLGGSPGLAAIFRNRLVYAASGYVVGTGAPPIRVFDGAYDRELTTLPPTSSGPAQAVVSLLVANGTIYLSTWDAGTTPATWTGRVFSLDLESATLTPIGGPFPAGHLPYALAWLNSQLWCGTQRQNASSGKVFAIRPGDAAWTEDHDLGAAGSVGALVAFHGSLYVGTTAAAATFGQVLKRAADGTYSMVDIGTLGAATANNGYLAFAVFLDALYAGYWNNDATPIATIRRSADGVTWTTAYSGAAGTLRPFIALMVDAGWLYGIGGGLGLTAAVVATQDGASWTDLTPQLPETDHTAVPAVGVVVR
jgi:hypothetical protein